MISLEIPVFSLGRISYPVQHPEAYLPLSTPLSQDFRDLEIFLLYPAGYPARYSPAHPEASSMIAMLYCF